MNPILERLRLDPQTITRFVVTTPATAQKPPRGSLNLTRKSRAYYRAWYKRNAAKKIAAGLTADGKPRKHTMHPELHGLPLKERHKLYMRMWRKPAALTSKP